ncbi:MAG: tetratricopeptide repeat protein [Polyangiaceae bacterium]
MTTSSIEPKAPQGRLDESLDRAKRAVSALQDQGDTPEAAEAFLDAARAQWEHGDVDEAVMAVDEAIGRARRAFGASDVHYARALEIGAEIAAAAGMPHAASARFEGALEALDRAGVTGELLADTLYHQGLFRRAQGDAGGAASSLLRAIEGAKDPASRAVLALSLTALGELVLDQGQAKEARELATRALEIWVELREVRRPEVGDAMSVLGRAALADGDPGTAADFLAPACAVYAKCTADVRERHAPAAAAHATALDALGQRKAAHDAYHRALALYREGDDHRMEIEQRLLELAREG